MSEWEYTERAQAERDRWTKRINEDMRNNPNLIWKSSWGGAPWYNTSDRYLRKSLRRKKQSTKRTISAKLRDAKESQSVGIAAVVILTLAVPMLILGMALVGALALFVLAGG